MTYESPTHIDDLNSSYPEDASAANAVGQHLRGIKSVLLTDLGNIDAPVTASAAQLNYLDITTLGTAQANKALTAGAAGAINGNVLAWSDLGTVTQFTMSSITVNEVSNDDTMASDSATALVTEAAAKGYVDTQVAALSNNVVLTAVIADVSTPETVYVAIPVTGTIVSIYSVLEGAIATSDATITVATATPATIGALTITASGSAAGDVDSNTSLSNASVTAGDYITVATDGASTNAERVWVYITISV